MLGVSGRDRRRPCVIRDMMTSNAPFEPVAAASRLLRTARTGALATLIPGAGDPYCSLVNVASDVDGAPLILVSSLAIHTANLKTDPRASLMLDARGAGDPLEGARVMLGGRFTPDSGERARRRYLAAQPEAAAFAGFADFSIWRLDLASVHLVAGFGRISDIPPADLLVDLAGAEALVAAEPDIVAHMNADHRDTMALYAERLCGAGPAPAGGWSCTGCDPEGLDMQAGRQAARLSFPARVNAPAALQKVLKGLADIARDQS